MKAQDARWFSRCRTVVMDDNLNVYSLSNEHLGINAIQYLAVERGIPFPLVGFWVDTVDNVAFKAFWIEEHTYGAFAC